MADGEQNKQSDFMIEKIKNRPINKKKLLRRTVTTAVMAVIFGLIACLTFLILEPVFSNWLYPEEEPPKIIFPEEKDEVQPEDMLVEEEPPDSIQEEVENILLEDEGIREILENIQLDQDNYIQLYNVMAEYVASLRPHMVTVTAVTSNEDWLNNVNERLGQTYGTIVASNGKELMILTDWATIRRATDIRVTFCDGQQVEATVKQTDEQTGLAVISVTIEDMPQETRDAAQAATLGSSSSMREPLGVPVVAMGCPLGTVGSIGYGMIAGEGGSLNLEDANYRTFITDIYGSKNAAGVLFDMQGKLIGIITPSLTYDDMPNAVMAIGISDLKKLIENMSNGKEAAYLGISAIDVTAEANQEMQVPFGAYVRDIAMDSPAMLAGIQRGDVIVEIDGSRIDNCINYTAVIQRMEAGQTIVVVVQRLSQDSYREMEMEITLGTAG